MGGKSFSKDIFDKGYIHRTLKFNKTTLLIYIYICLVLNKYYTKMTDSKHLERCFILCATQKMQIQTSQTHKPIRTAQIQKTDTNPWQGWEWRDSQSLLLGSECVLILKGSKSGLHNPTNRNSSKETENLMLVAMLRTVNSWAQARCSLHSSEWTNHGTSINGTLCQSYEVRKI